jgi:hypothetical protein
MTLEHFKYMPDGTPRSDEAATAEYNQIFDLAVEIINGQGAQIRCSLGTAFRASLVGLLLVSSNKL